VRLNPHANNARALMGLWRSALEWLSRQGGASASKSSSRRAPTARVDDIDEDAADADGAAAGDEASHAASQQLTPVIATGLVSLADSRLKQFYQSSPLLPVLELTLRRHSGRG